MQLVLLGMHRSGTSVAAGLINMMGAYFGPTGSSIGANPENPKGFWERRDVRDLNDFLLHSIDCDWNRVSTFSVDKIPSSVLREFEDRASQIIEELDANRPWIIKEPRFCLLLELWNRQLCNPITIYIHRNPLEVARSLQTRNNIPVHVGLALWEFYTISALSSSTKSSRVFVSHQRLLDNPVNEVESLFNQLEALDVKSLRLPSNEQIQSFVSSELHRERARQGEIEVYLSSNQRELLERIAKEQNIPIDGLEVSNACINALSDYEAGLNQTAELKAQYVERNKKLRTVEAETSTKIQKLHRQIDELKTHLSVSDEKLKHVTIEHQAALKKLQDREGEIDVLEERVTRLHEENRIKQQEFANIQSLIAKQSNEFSQQLEYGQSRSESTLINMESKLSSLTQRNSELETLLDTQIKALTMKLQLARRALIESESHLAQQEELAHRFSAGVNKLLSSRRWRFGNSLFSMRHRALLQKDPPTAADYLGWLQQDYRSLKKQSSPVQFHVLELLDDDEHTAPNNIADKNRLEESYTLPRVNALSLDIVVCIHNALEDTSKCLDSIVAYTACSHNLFLIDDGSNNETAKYLRSFSLSHDNCVLIRHEEARGYTKSANVGLKRSVSDFVVLLNSDTVVTPGWDQKLLDCVNSAPEIGIVGPLSNAASWQSVPSRRDPNGDWMVNEIPTGHNINSVANLITKLSTKQYPQVALVNGFCFGIHRDVIEKIGFLDEDRFPKGYGEENDYCLRAGKAGFKLALADNAYVYHSKSKSFSHDGRRKLSKLGGQVLKDLYGEDVIQHAVDTVKNSPALKMLRNALSFSLTYRESDVPEYLLRSKLKVLFLLPVSGGGGGVHSIVQETIGLRNLGVYARVAVYEKHRAKFKQHYPDYWKSVFCFVPDRESMEAYADEFNVVVATIFTSVKILDTISVKNKNVAPCYYIQDYEPWFCEKGTELHTEALASYTRIKHLRCFAKTNWLCDLVFSEHGVEVAKVKPSIDQSIFYSENVESNDRGLITVSAMIRPSTPRRAPGLTMDVLGALKKEYGDDVEIKIFGCDDDHHFFQGSDWSFEYTNFGHVVRSDVADILRSSDIFLDLSSYQAFGRTGLEAMACGCVPVLPQKGGVHEYAVHGQDSLIVDTSKSKSNDIVERVCSLIDDPDNLTKMRNSALEKASGYSIAGAADSLREFFFEAVRKKIQ